MNRFILLLSLILPMHTSAAVENVVNIYSFRQAELINPLINAFTQQTGIKINVVSGKANVLMQRLIDDGQHSFADVLLTTDVARLEQAKQLKIIQPIQSEILINNIPKSLRDPEHYWFGTSIRARAIFYSKSRVNPSELTTYQDLTHKKWQGKLCSRKGSHFYNRSMVASFIHHHGQAWANQWTEEFVSNLAMRPQGGDRDQLRLIAKGSCDVTIANSYYYGMLSSSEKANDRDVYQKVGIIFPNAENTGTHVNISGAAVTSAAKNKQNAIKFIEFLTTSIAQQFYAELNHEYPIRADMSPSPLLSSWGKLVADKQAILQLPKFHQQAKTIIKDNRW